MGTLDKDRLVRNSGGGNRAIAMDSPAWGASQMSKDRPIRLPFGVTLTACHGLPMLVVSLVVATLCFLMVGGASRAVSPATLSTIWIESPHSDGRNLPQIKSSEAADKTAVKIGKTGHWTRLCPSYAIETFFDDGGNQISQSDRHDIDVPDTAGIIRHAPRPIMLPKSVANTPGIYKLRLSVYSVCWPWENIFPIPSTSAEAAFQIVAD